MRMIGNVEPHAKLAALLEPALAPPVVALRSQKSIAGNDDRNTGAILLAKRPIAAPAWQLGSVGGVGVCWHPDRRANSVLLQVPRLAFPVIAAKAVHDEGMPISPASIGDGACSPATAGRPESPGSCAAATSACGALSRPAAHRTCRQARERPSPDGCRRSRRAAS